MPGTSSFSCRELLDIDSLSVNRRAHRATRVACGLIGGAGTQRQRDEKRGNAGYTKGGVGEPDRYRNSRLHSPAPPCPGLSRDPATCLPGYSPGAPGPQVIGGHPVTSAPSRRKPHEGRMARLVSLVVVTVLLFASVPVGAQQPVAPPPPQIPYGAPISLEQAKKVMAGAEAEAKKNNWNMVIAVLDSGGHLVMLARMDGTQLGSIDAAKDKAYSAVLYRRPTKVFLA